MNHFEVIMPFFLTVFTLLVLSLQAFLEHPLNLAVVVMPMVKRGFWGKVTGRFFYPGWPSGVCYIFLLLLLITGGVALEALHRYRENPVDFYNGF